MATAIADQNLPALPRYFAEDELVLADGVVRLTNRDGLSWNQTITVPIHRHDLERWQCATQNALEDLCEGRIQHATLQRWTGWRKAPVREPGRADMQAVGA